MVSLALLLLGLGSISQCCVVPYRPNERYDGRKNYCKEVLPGETPYQISVQKVQATHFFKHLCSGALLTFDFAITAAHCVFNQTPSQLYVLAGTVNLTDGILSRVRNIITPDEYTLTEPCNNNIALLALEWKLLPNTTIGVVLLPPPFSSQNKSNKQHLATVSGYERIEKLINLSLSVVIRRDSRLSYDQLFKADSHVISHKDCTIYYKAFHCSIFNTQICTFDWSKEYQKNIRDVGVPLVYKGTLLGIASCPKDCSYRQLPNLFTNVTTYVTWIKQKIHLNSCTTPSHTTEFSNYHPIIAH